MVLLISTAPGTSIMLLTSPLIHPWPPLSCSGENLKVILKPKPHHFTSFNLPYLNPLPLKYFSLLYQNFIFVFYFVLFKLNISSPPPPGSSQKTPHSYCIPKNKIQS
jgi:hypothetical protein